MAKYIKCPRCELNYILEGEDYCYVCKSEMKHHTENDEDDLLDIEDMELCPVCGQNYITEDQTMCDECKGKAKSENPDSDEWKDDEEENENSAAETSSDVDNDDEYNSGFSDIDVTEEENDPYKTETEDDIGDETSPIDFIGSDDEIEESFDDEVIAPVDDFETVEVSDDDEEEDEEDEEEDYEFGDDDILGKKK